METCNNGPKNSEKSQNSRFCLKSLILIFKSTKKIFFVLPNPLLRGFIVLTLQKLYLVGWLVGKFARKSLSQSFKSNCGNVKLIAVIINADDDHDNKRVLEIFILAKSKMLGMFLDPF